MESKREGNLEAPTRHALDWKNPDFYDEAQLNEELERVFDICHGCRRCVNLCNSFPTLFDLVDESDTMEVDGVAKDDYIKVVDECYLCDMCYMAKCPYVPPHQFNVDFPHLMLRAKAVNNRKNGLSKSDQLLSATDKQGKLAGIPLVTETINAVNHWAPARAMTEKMLGVDRDAWLPDFTSKPLRKSVKATLAEVVDGNKTPGKVAIFATCYINNNEPEIGRDLIRVLEHNKIQWTFAQKEVCCGMPKLEQGDLESVERLKRVNIPVLAELAAQGYALMSAVPSCTLMFKQELPLMFPDDEQVQAVKAAFWDPFEYLIVRMKDGLISTDFTQPLGNVSYHFPCHGRVQNVGRKTEEFLKLIPDTVIHTNERCSGHAGTYGVKKAHHKTAMKIGKPLFRKMAEVEPDYISSDCPLGGHHIAQGIGENHDRQMQPLHPISLVAKAYGLSE